MPAGRPTSYEERYCDLLIEHMAKGFSFESFAGLIGVSKDTLFEWNKVHKEFSDSKKIATEKCRVFWENIALENIINRETMVRDQDGNITQTKTALNSSVWIFNMKNRFKDEWRDKQETEVSGTLSTVILPKPIGEDESE
jgi:hypothetical protein